MSEPLQTSTLLAKRRPDESIHMKAPKTTSTRRQSPRTPMPTKSKVTTNNGSKVKRISQEKKTYPCKNTNKIYHVITNPNQPKRQE
ncbi:hypothetical protein F8M41_019665 [Gigaspora margarita]|uniref:Uncharacterized protein n=1 Tax=Gigaspora margarita TaxID=4874 RepID=A0A8H4AJM1_GIGMA|nr:hypothetical protein F8M41_019665 [Gigaspora margarita]